MTKYHNFVYHPHHCCCRCHHCHCHHHHNLVYLLLFAEKEIQLGHFANFLNHMCKAPINKSSTVLFIDVICLLRETGHKFNAILHITHTAGKTPNGHWYPMCWRQQSVGLNVFEWHKVAHILQNEGSWATQVTVWQIWHNQGVLCIKNTKKDLVPLSFFYKNSLKMPLL